MRRRLVATALASLSLFGGACTPLVRYTNELVSEERGRTYFTRVPAAFGGTIGFAVGVPIDVAALPATFVFYRTQPKETRDPLSVFLFPSFVLWKVGKLVGAPFDALEWAAWRSWQPEVSMTPDEREAIERQWDAREFSAYPVAPIYPR